MLNIAITGGIGSGKTEVSNHLRDLGYTVIDADAISREMTAEGGKALPLIRAKFGEQLFREDGSLDRAAVREMIYNDPAKKALYESCTTRLVLDDIAAIRERSELSGEEVIFYDIPLLFETGTEGDYDAVWVVVTDTEIRKRRIRERSSLEDAVIESIMEKQMSDQYKINRADYVIYNNGTLDELHSATKKALKTFLK